VLFALAATGEMVVDKLPFVPDRIGAGPLLGRMAMGGGRLTWAKRTEIVTARRRPPVRDRPGRPDERMVSCREGVMSQREMGSEEVSAFLGEGRVARFAFHAEGRAYLIPLGYVMREEALCVATSAGEKTRLAALQPRVAFQVDDAHDSLVGWRSVTGEGAWEVVEESAEREAILELLLQRFPELAAWGRGEARAKAAGGALVLARVRPLWTSGRAFAGPSDGG
jgi:nitroimidazol reductase NimA-like FMN-containing flavoprotein (pyridoxamine 5'-phosphate oxidase superfamily)